MFKRKDAVEKFNDVLANDEVNSQLEEMKEKLTDQINENNETMDEVQAMIIRLTNIRGNLEERTRSYQNMLDKLEIL